MDGQVDLEKLQTTITWLQCYLVYHALIVQTFVSNFFQNYGKLALKQRKLCENSTKHTPKLLHYTGLLYQGKRFHPPTCSQE